MDSLAPAPAPMIIWSSSMNRIVSPSASASSRNFCILSSKSPRNLVPDSIPTRSREMIFLSFRFAGIAPSAIRCASPSTTAVFPTPGSPVRTGLFLVLRERIWISLSITSSLPIIGSYPPSRAFSVTSVPYFSIIFSSCSSLSRASPSISPAGTGALPPPSSLRSSSGSASRERSIWDAAHSPASRIPLRISSGSTLGCPWVFARLSARWITCSASWEIWTARNSPAALASRSY